MASVVAARDEKEKERRDASVGLRARPRASSVLPRPPRPSRALKSSFFKINLASGWLETGVGFRARFRNLLLYADQLGSTNPVSKWKTVEDEPLPAVVGGARRVAALLFRLFGSCFGARCFFRRFALKSGRLRRPRPQPGTPRSGSWSGTLVRHRPLSSKATVCRFTRHPSVTAAARRGSIRNPPPNNKPPPLLINLST